MPTAPVDTGKAERAARPASPPEPQRSARPTEQGSRAPRRDTKPAPPRRTRYAAPSEPPAPSQFRATAAPAGTAANVRAYSFAANGGRVIDASGTRVQIIRVR
jgi:hypothetical protein